MQWLAAPQLDELAAPAAHAVCLHRARSAAAADRVASATCGGGCSGRFDRVVVHSARGLETLAELGVAEERIRVIPHPVFPSDPPRADDGRTVLALGVIRPYKGLADAIAASGGWTVRG